MKRKIYFLISLWSVTSAKDPELPLCPTNFNFLPQPLPMHCRMPTKSDLRGAPFMPGSFPGLPSPYPIPQPGAPLMQGFGAQLAAMPAVPGPPGPPVPLPALTVSAPGPMPGFPGPLTALPGMPGSLSAMPGISGPMPRMGPVAHKLPVVVMPFYSQDPAFKNREKRRKPKSGKRRNLSYSDDESTSEDSSSDEELKRKIRKRLHHTRRHKPRTPVLTPRLQYVTKDGYVIYEKTLSNGEAKDWETDMTNLEHKVKGNNNVDELTDGMENNTELHKNKKGHEDENNEHHTNYEGNSYTLSEEHAEMKARMIEKLKHGVKQRFARIRKGLKS